MSAVNDPNGGMLTKLVEAQRGMSDAEVAVFLATGVYPDLSLPPDVSLPVGSSDDAPVMSEDSAREWLSGMTASGGGDKNFFVSKSHSEILTSETITFDFDPHQPRDKSGRWTDGAPGVATIKVKTGLKPGKQITPAKIYKKHSDGDVVAVSSSGNRRMRWSDAQKKFITERATSDGSWQQESSLGKSAAYTEAKAGKWHEPLAQIPTQREVGSSTDKTGQKGTKLGPSTPPQTPEPEQSVVEPTVETTAPSTDFVDAQVSTGKTPVSPTKAIYRSGISHNETVAETSNGSQRLRWDADHKKFALESRGANGEWNTTETLSKKNAYERVKSGGWFTPTGVTGDSSSAESPTPAPPQVVTPVSTPTLTSEITEHPSRSAEITEPDDVDPQVVDVPDDVIDSADTAPLSSDEQFNLDVAVQQMQDLMSQSAEHRALFATLEKKQIAGKALSKDDLKDWNYATSQMEQLVAQGRTAAESALSLLSKRDGSPWGDNDSGVWSSTSKPSLTTTSSLDPTTRDKLRTEYVVKDKQTLTHNQSLRSGNPSSAAKSWRTRMRALLTSQKTINDSVVFRGTALTPEKIMELRPGTVMSDKGSMSTDTGEDRAMFYMNARLKTLPGTIPTLFEIRVPKGTTAVDVGHDEVVFDFDTPMRIISSTRDGNGVVRVVAEVGDGSNTNTSSTSTSAVQSPTPTSSVPKQSTSVPTSVPTLTAETITTPSTSAAENSATAKLTQMKSAYNDGYKVLETFNGGNVADAVELVELSNGTRAVLKSDSNVKRQRREVLAAKIANAVGISDYYADTVDDSGTKIIMPHINGEPGVRKVLKAIEDNYKIDENGFRKRIRDISDFDLADEVRDKMTRLPGGKEIAILDWIISNRDRDSRNWMITPDNQVLPIDHGNADLKSQTYVDHTGKLREHGADSPFAIEWLGVKVNKYGQLVSIKPKVPKSELAPIRARLEALSDQFVGDDEREMYESMLERFDRLYKKAPK